MPEPRIRLYQYAHSPYCIPIQLLLRDGDILHEVLNLAYGDPARVIELTQGRAYHVPVIEDLETHEIIWDRDQNSHEVAEYLQILSPGLDLFPAPLKGVHGIVLRYIENDCEEAGFKLADAAYERWTHSDLERGLLRRHKERKYGVGCLERWQMEADDLARIFCQRIACFDQMLSQQPYLFGDLPIFADYALAGVVKNFLFPGTTAIPQEWSYLKAWLTRMEEGRLVVELDETQRSARDQFGRQSEKYARGHILENVEDVQAALQTFKITPGRKALDVATGAGFTAAYLAGLKLEVTASDITPQMLERTAELAAERGVKITLQQHPAEQLPYADGSFDLVTCRVAAHHFSHPAQFVSEAARVLRPYGYFVLIDGTVSDDQLEAESWMHEIEKLRDPSHHRFITPRTWAAWCQQRGLKVIKQTVTPMEMPDLNWYFETANTPPENRRKVMEMIGRAPRTARELFQITQAGGKIRWWWQRLTLVASKM